MPACSTAAHPSGASIKFTEEDHRYSSVIDGKEIEYISGTTFLGRYFQPFDPTGVITERCAKREGLTVEEIKEKWAAKGRESCRLGTRMHELCEDIELNREIRNTPEDETEKKRFDNASKMAHAFRNGTDILGVEKIVFDPDLRIAGTIDLFSKSRKNGKYLIIDHKSNAEIERVNKYKKFCMGPVSHLPDLSFWHYGLQLNLYAYLLRRGKYVPKDAQFMFYLNHVTPEKAELIELPDLQTEIRECVIDWLLSKEYRDLIKE